MNSVTVGALNAPISRLMLILTRAAFEVVAVGIFIWFFLLEFYYFIKLNSNLNLAKEELFD